jgi:hypothetical protein
MKPTDLYPADADDALTVLTIGKPLGTQSPSMLWRIMDKLYNWDKQQYEDASGVISERYTPAPFDWKAYWIMDDKQRWFVIEKIKKEDAVENTCQRVTIE